MRYTYSDDDDCGALRVARANPAAVLPTRGSSRAAGLDLSSIECAIIPPLSRKLLSTGLVVSVPDGTYGRIAPRSGIALRSGVGVGAGVIDADYRGTLQVLLFNHDATEPFEVRIGDRIAQLVLERVSACEPVLVPLEELCPPSPPTSAADDQPQGKDTRGAGGFGSTGV